VELEDRITVTAPEGIDLQMVLAGAASRFIAGSVDLAIELLLIFLAAFVFLGLVKGGVGTALFAMAAFVALYLYNVLFEVLAAGRTPGKRFSHLRVVRGGGAPVDLPASAIRNLVRLLDALPGAYLVGILSILLTKRNQRLGDLAAGTLVIRELPSGRPREDAPPSAGLPATVGWDVSAVEREELAVVRRFLERRSELDARARGELASRLEQGLRKKVAGVPVDLAPEAFLEALVHAKAAR